MSDSHQSHDGEKGAGGRGTEVTIKDNAPDPQAALPPGTLKGPFLERQGDEQRQPSKEELHELTENQARQNGRRKE